MPETNNNFIVPPHAPQAPSQDHHIPRWVWLTVFGITIAAIAAFSIWLLFFTPEPAVAPVVQDQDEQVTDPYADWETYRNEEHGFEVKYPDEFTSTFINETKVLELG